MRIHFPEHLPISAHAEEIRQALEEHQVLVVAGDTGSGKTTQLPKICLRAGLGRKAMIGCTQPRRIAAVSMAERLAAELEAPDLVASTIRFQDRRTPKTRIRFMTDGILLAATRQDPDLRDYDCIIIDEAHERSLNIDFLLGYVHRLLARRADLKLIISSATIDTERFCAFFGQAPLIRVEGRTWPIETRYLPPEDEDAGLVEHAAWAVEQVVAEGPGDVLVFMPTERDIRECVDLLRNTLSGCHVLPLFGRLRGADQRRIFKKLSRRKIVVATNVAETSITVPGIRFVVDSGLARISRYNPRARTSSLKVERISRASADQRQGRCGRTGPGICVRLYSEEDYLSRPAHTLPEIRRSNLAEVILRMTDLRLGDPRDFPFIDPPHARAVNDGYRLLGELGALRDGEGRQPRLTRQGRLMARLPLDPRISRILLHAADNGCLREVRVIAAALSIQDPRIRPADQEKEADAVHRDFLVEGSDFLSHVKIWDLWHRVYRQVGSLNRMRKFCRAHFLSFQRMREWLDLHHQLGLILGRNHLAAENREPASPEAVHQALCAGFLRHIGQRADRLAAREGNRTGPGGSRERQGRSRRNTYRIGGGGEAVLHPGSALRNHAPEWIVAAGFVETSQLFARTCAAIDPGWLEELAGDLCTSSWSDPVYEESTGRVRAMETVRLFGLIIDRRQRDHGRAGPAQRAEARALFIQEALVAGRLRGRYPFLEHNLALVQRLRDEEDRLRTRGLVVDDQGLAAFYDQALPAGVYDRFTLNRFLKRTGSAGVKRRLFMSEEALRLARPDGDELHRFPPFLENRGLRLPLRYRFQPGHEEDGVSVDIPASALESLDPLLFEWLTPGLLPEKITRLLKGLPKRLRGRLAPLPDTVDVVLDCMDLGRGSLYAALERALLRCRGVRVERGDWRPELLPPHLRFRYRILDSEGRELAAGRSLSALREDLGGHKEDGAEQPPGKGGSPGRGPARQGNDGIQVVRSGIRDWDLDGLEPARAVDGDCLAHLALRETEDGGVDVVYARPESRARALTREGLPRLYLLAEDGCLAAGERRLARECKASLKRCWAAWLSLDAPDKGGDLAQALLGFLLRDILHAHDGRLPTGQDFGRRLRQVAKQGLVRLGLERLERIEALLMGRGKILERLEKMEARAAKQRTWDEELFKRLRRQARRLPPRDFLHVLRMEDIEAMFRHQRGLLIRMERAAYDPARDAAKEEMLRPFTAWLGRMRQRTGLTPACNAALDEFAAMVEEYRLAVFAPEVKRAFKVSEKRLHRRMAEIEDLCRAME